MGNLAFALGQVPDAERWIEEGIELGRSAERPEGGSWGYHWRGRQRIRDGAPGAALRELAIARTVARSASPPARWRRTYWRRSRKTPATRTGTRATAPPPSGHTARRSRFARRSSLRAPPMPSSRPASSTPSLNSRHGCSRCARTDEARAETERAITLLRRQAEAPGAVASRFTELAWLLLVAQPADLRDATAALASARRAVGLPLGQHPDALAVLAVALVPDGRRRIGTRDGPRGATRSSPRCAPAATRRRSDATYAKTCVDIRSDPCRARSGSNVHSFRSSSPSGAHRPAFRSHPWMRRSPDRSRTGR